MIITIIKFFKPYINNNTYTVSIKAKFYVDESKFINLILHRIVTAALTMIIHILIKHINEKLWDYA